MSKEENRFLLLGFGFLKIHFYFDLFKTFLVKMLCK